MPVLLLKHMGSIA
jgi:hypothetical protein